MSKATATQARPTAKCEHVFPHKQKRKVVNTMSIDSMLELVNQYKEAAQLIEAAQAEQELIKAQIKA